MELAFPGLLSEIVQDLQHPDLVWQFAVIAVAVLCGWLAERAVQQRQVHEGRRAVQVGRRGLKRVVLPLVALTIVGIALLAMQHHHHVNLLRLAMPLFASLALIRTVFFVLRLTFSHSAWLASFERVFATLAWSVVALHITGFLPDLIDLLESASFKAGSQQLNLWVILQGIVAIAIALLLSMWAGSLIEARLLAAQTLDTNLKVVFARLARAALLLLAIMLSLPAVGIDLTALSVFGGAIGVGLGLGLQRIASNYVAGFIILLDRSIRLGNTISVGTEKGKVTRITTRYTVLRSGNGTDSLIPNETLIGTTVQNEGDQQYSVRHQVNVQVAYQSDLNDVLKRLTMLAAQHPDIPRSPEPQALVEAFADSGINLLLYFWLDNPETGAAKVRSDLLLAIWADFRAAGIEIPYPQREIRMLSSQTG